MADEKAKPEVKKANELSETKEKRRKLLGVEPTETRHVLQLRGESLPYTARAGAIPLKDPFDEVEAEVFFTAYELDGAVDRSARPLTFAFNGGPGSASIWLHMGALGPKRVVMEKEGWMPAPPYRYESNPFTWLDQTDLVFVDPVGTGFSRAAKEDFDKKFWSFKGDIESMGEFIRLYLTRYRRWTSPLFLAGESYGTTRAAGLAGHLVDRGIAFNGIVLISTVLDLAAIRFMPANDLPYQLFVPSYAATAWYHGRLAGDLQKRALPDLVAEVKAWAEGDFTLALMKGDRLTDAERRSVGKRLARYTGLSLDYILGTNLRVEIHRFCKELLRGERRSVGRLDSRFKGVEALAVTERPEFDPSMLAITPPYTAAFNQYVRSELGIETDLTYETLSRTVNEKWEWEKGHMPATGETLRGAIAKNPYTKVLVAQGYYDLATPVFATEYMLSHMNVDPAFRGNLEMECYEAGHMFYLDLPSLAAFREDVRGFIAASTGGDTR
ncbi:MAG: Carboxypeptidase-related protein [Candidatus Bipolaricaulis sibiricus]|uniref:Carboxypeptidase-related protein n=1 Tax=Bipolaricaulis sibiricus TaxID=2501609 RepID=A0A410FUX3_BIPS1|nr:MAG: Carboxypeptidase-related protein [Candidatus Bipolaricaulis sibiricus]